MLLDPEQCNALSPDLVDTVECENPDCLERKVWLIVENGKVIMSKHPPPEHQHRNKHEDEDIKGTGVADLIPPGEGIEMLETLGLMVVGGAFAFMAMLWFYLKMKEQHKIQDRDLKKNPQPIKGKLRGKHAKKDEEPGKDGGKEKGRKSLSPEGRKSLKGRSTRTHVDETTAQDGAEVVHALKAAIW